MSADQRIHFYFTKLNSLSEKIAQDISTVKSAYSRDDWTSLSLAEQEKKINDNLINAEIYAKYLTVEDVTLGKISKTKIANKSNKTQDCRINYVTHYFNGQDLQTYFHPHFGLKVLHDENSEHGHCRDEHSFPFSYRTESQVNIPATLTFELAKYDSSPKKTETRSHLNTLEAGSTFIRNINQDARNINFDKNEISSSIAFPQCEENPNILFTFSARHTVLTELSDDESEFNDLCHEESSKLLKPQMQIPKGFDFLSNW